MKIRKVHVLNQDTLVVFFTDGTTGMYPVCDLLAWSQRVLPVRNKEIANDNLLAAAQSRLKPTVWSGAQVAGMPLAGFPGSAELPSRDELLRRVRNAGPEVLELKGNTWVSKRYSSCRSMMQNPRLSCRVHRCSATPSTKQNQYDIWVGEAELLKDG